MNTASWGSWKRAADGAQTAGPRDFFWFLSPTEGGWLRETSFPARNYGCRMGHITSSLPGLPPLPA